jgi:RNA recognition motif-containing protein
MTANTESPKVFVGNLSFDTTADDLRSLFKTFAM